MKSILLTSTALVAFAGAAAADGHAAVSNALSGTLGYQSEIDGIGEDGFYWEGNLKTTATATLDNGITAGAYFEITVAGDDGAQGNDGGQDLVSSDFVVSLTSDTASLFFGDTGMAAQKHWVSAGDMEADGFSTGSDDAVLRGDVSIAGVDASVSVVANDDANDTEQLSFGAGASFGAISVSAGYQAEASSGYTNGSGDFNNSEIFGVSASGSFAGATVTLAYASNQTADTSSTGIKVAYPFGPVTATAYYVMEEGTGGDEPNIGVNLAYANGPLAASVDVQDDQGTTKYKVEGSYDLGNGLTVLAGVLNENEGDDVDYYVAGKYDLGGGASVLAAYAGDEDGDQGDEIGAGEYDPGMTVEVSFSF